VNFSDLPGLTPVALDQLDIGDEGDIALDDALHVYFVDTKVKEDSVTPVDRGRSGKGQRPVRAHAADPAELPSGR